MNRMSLRAKRSNLPLNGIHLLMRIFPIKWRLLHHFVVRNDINDLFL
jgi:hypothetical protein